MTKGQATEMWLGGAFLLVAEFRSFKVETPTMRDKETGRAVSRVVSRSTLEIGQESVMVTEWHPDGTPAAAVVSGVRKGALGVLHVESLVRERGILTGRGRFEAFTDK